MKRRLAIAIAGLLVVVVVFIALLPWLLSGDVLVARLPADPGVDASFEVRKDTFQEIQMVLKYRVVINDWPVSQSLPYPIVAVPIGTRLTEADFVVYDSRTEHVSALAFRSKPHEVLAMYDFSTGETWPWRAPFESRERRDSVGAKMLAKLQAAKAIAVNAVLRSRALD